MNNSSNPLIYLASASPRRSALLRQICAAHEVRPVHVDETRLPQESPGRYVERLAALKAETLWTQLSPVERRAVLGADTTVALGEQVLEKPADAADGLRMLALLSGRTHQVYTAVALRHEGGCAARLSVSEVTFRELSAEERAAYWRTGEPVDKAGGYAVQGLAAVFIERISGSYSGIMGLPLFETAQLLQTIGWRLPAAPAAQTDARVNG